VATKFDSTRLNSLIAADQALHEEIRQERARRSKFIADAAAEYDRTARERLASTVRSMQQRLRDYANRGKISRSAAFETDPTGLNVQQLRSLIGTLQALFP